MKRTWILALGILVLSASAAFAQAPTTPQPPSGATVGANFVDANGDGVCDLFQSGNRQGQGGGKAQRGKRLGPQDGSGYGAPAGAGTGTGICDGTGPKGKGRGPRGGSAEQVLGRDSPGAGAAWRARPHRVRPGCPSHATQSHRS